MNPVIFGECAESRSTVGLPPLTIKLVDSFSPQRFSRRRLLRFLAAYFPLFALAEIGESESRLRCCSFSLYDFTSLAVRFWILFFAAFFSSLPRLAQILLVDLSVPLKTSLH